MLKNIKLVSCKSDKIWLSYRKKLFCARAILRVSRNTSSGIFDFFSMNASHLEDIFKLNRNKVYSNRVKNDRFTSILFFEKPPKWLKIDIFQNGKLS